MQVFTDEFSWLLEGLPTYTLLHEKGMRLYNLGALKHAEQFLQLPATTGNADAQFALADIIEHTPSENSNQITTLKQQIERILQIDRPGEFYSQLVARATQLIETLEDNQKARYMPLYEASAEQGNIDAMLRLRGNAWEARAHRQLESGVRNHDPEAILNMYALTRDLAWLKHAAATGHAIAQYLLATLYDKDPALVTDGADPRDTVYELITRSANGGYPPAMYWYANHIENRNNFAFIQQWRIREAQAGSINAVQRYGLALTGMDSDETHNDTLSGSEADYVKGYALLWLVHQIKGRGHNPYSIPDKLAHLESELSTEQIAAAKRAAHEWHQQYPLLSEFRLRTCLR